MVAQQNPLTRTLVGTTAWASFTLEAPQAVLMCPGPSGADSQLDSGSPFGSILAPT